jgi:hypothetical protein
LPSRNDGRAADGAGDAARGVAFEFGGDEFVDAEQLGDRPGDEVVGGGDDGHQVACALVRCTRPARLRPQRRACHLVDEALLAGKLLGRGLRSRQGAVAKST